MDRAVTEEMLMEKFKVFGSVSSVTIVLDKVTKLSKGFGFVDMPVQAEGEAAIKALNLTKLLKQTIRVKVAAPKPEETKSV
jgi:RNA recognition motif-containing protein